MPADFSMPILVVDDYQTMVRIIRNLLKQIGYEKSTRRRTDRRRWKMIRRSATASSSPTGTWSR